METVAIQRPAFDLGAFVGALLAFAPGAQRKSAARSARMEAREFATYFAQLPETIAAQHAAVVSACAARTGDWQYAERCAVTAHRFDAMLRSLRNTKEREALIVRTFDRADLPKEVGHDVADHLASWSARKVRAVIDARANLARAPGRIVVCVESRAQGEDRVAFDVHVGTSSARKSGAPKSGAPEYDRKIFADAVARKERESVVVRMLENAPVKAGATVASFAERLATLRAHKARQLEET